MTTTDELIDANAAYADDFDHAGLEKEPSRRVAVLTCMDARLDAYRFLGLDPGQAHVIRNAGGIVTDDAIRSLMISGRSLGTTEIAVIQHTSCGMSGLDDDVYAGDVEVDTGTRPPFPLGGFADLETSVRASVQTLRDSPFIPQTSVRGFVYDVESGRITEVA